MGDVSAHFSRWEFACKDDCGFDVVDAELLGVLEGVRQHFDASVTIASGCRCSARNNAVGGGLHSQHMLGKAADFTVKGVEPNGVAGFLEKLYPDQYGIGRYDTWTHIDVRDDKARWDRRKRK